MLYEETLKKLTDQFLSSAYLPPIDLDDLLVELDDIHDYPVTSMAEELSSRFCPRSRLDLDEVERVRCFEFMERVDSMLEKYEEDSEGNAFLSRDFKVCLGGPFRSKQGDVICFLEIFDQVSKSFVLPDLRYLSGENSFLHFLRDPEFFESERGIRTIFKVETDETGYKDSVFPITNQISNFESLRNLLEIPRPTNSSSEYCYLNDFFEAFIENYYFEKMRSLFPGRLAEVSQNFKELIDEGYFVVLNTDGMYSSDSFNFSADVRVPNPRSYPADPHVESLLLTVEFINEQKINFRVHASKILGKETEVFDRP